MSERPSFPEQQNLDESSDIGARIEETGINQASVLDLSLRSTGQTLTELPESIEGS